MSYGSKTPLPRQASVSAAAMTARAILAQRKSDRARRAKILQQQTRAVAETAE